MYVCASICVYMSVCVYTHTLCVFICVCRSVYACAHTHTHRHTFRSRLFLSLVLPLLYAVAYTITRPYRAHLPLFSPPTAPEWLSVLLLVCLPVALIHTFCLLFSDTLHPGCLFLSSSASLLLPECVSSLVLSTCPHVPPPCLWLWLSAFP